MGAHPAVGLLLVLLIQDDPVSGRWEGTVRADFQGQSFTEDVTFELTHRDGKVTGRVSTSRGDGDVTGTYDAAGRTLKLKGNAQGYTVDIVAKVGQDTMTGDVRVMGLAKGTFEAKRVSRPGGGGSKNGKPEGNACDVRTLKKMPYCERCDRILSKGELAGRNRCARCLKAGLEGTCSKVWACRKVFYRCEKDGKKSLRRRRCPTCGGKMERVEDYALVEFRCRKCGGLSKDRRRCSDPDCRASHPEPVCRKSGTFPHVRSR